MRAKPAPLSPTINRERLVPVLEAIAIRAVVNAPTIQPFDTLPSAHATENRFPRWGYVSYGVLARHYGRVLFEFQPIPGTVAIITVPANELVAQIHDRMRLILPKATYERWLGQ